MHSKTFIRNLIYNPLFRPHHCKLATRPNPEDISNVSVSPSNSTDSSSVHRPIKKKSIFFPSHSDQPNYDINEVLDGLHGGDYDMPFMDRVAIAKYRFGFEFKKFKKHYINMNFSDRVPLFASEINDKETLILFNFDETDHFKKWKVGTDKDSNMGYSTCELVQTTNKTGLFRGYIDTNVPRTGWAMMKSMRPMKPFDRKDSFLGQMLLFNHIILKIRGDGRTYFLNLNCPAFFDVTKGDMFCHPIQTHGGPYWQYLKIPYARFYKANYGKVDKQQDKLEGKKVSTFTILLADNITGPFQFEIDWLGLYNDVNYDNEEVWERHRLPTGEITGGGF